MKFEIRVLSEMYQPNQSRLDNLDYYPHVTTLLWMNRLW